VDKKRARLNCLRHFLWMLPYPGKNEAILKPDERVVGPASQVFEASEKEISRF